MGAGGKAAGPEPGAGHAEAEQTAPGRDFAGGPVHQPPPDRAAGHRGRGRAPPELHGAGLRQVLPGDAAQ